MCEFDFKDNSFNFIRLICAFQVFYGHGLEAFHLQSSQLLTNLLLMFRGVPIFFALSGYLIWNSLDRDDRPMSYFKKRFLRLYPELWLTVALSITTLLPFVDVKNYQFFVWIFGQSTLFQFWTPDMLRVYGVGTPNGALWTVTIFAQFYTCVYCFRQLYRKANKISDGVYIILVPIMGIVINILWIFGCKNNLPEIADKLYKATVLPYIWIFGMGMLLCAYREHIIPILVRCFYPLMILLALHCLLQMPDFNVENYLIFRTVLSVLFVFSLAYKFSQLKIRTDISYEFYLLHMIVINVFVELGMMQNYAAYFCSAVVTLILSFVLWKANTSIIYKYS